MFDKIFGSILILGMIVSLIIPQQVEATTQWNVNLPQATDSKSNWPGEVTSQWNIQDNLLSNYRRGLWLSYTSASSLTMGSGEIVVSSAGAQPRLFLANTTTTTLTTANLDTGSSFSSSTTYYVYAGAASSTASTVTPYISLSNTAPTGVTYFAQIGTFFVNASGNIDTINNLVPVTSTTLQTPNPNVSSSCNSVFQNTTGMRLLVVGSAALNNGNNQGCYIGETSSPSTQVCNGSTSASGNNTTNFAFVVPTGWYYEITSYTTSGCFISSWQI